jgi:hypothetical protein|eukprot:COSAG06_NODE_81_length_25302_cov_21.168902_19_plen_136_part_00
MSLVSVCWRVGMLAKRPHTRARPQFAKNFRDEIAESGETISFPMVSTKFLSESVLVESWATGRSVDTLFDSSVSSPEVKKALADKLYDRIVSHHIILYRCPSWFVSFRSYRFWYLRSYRVAVQIRSEYQNVSSVS